MKNFLLQFSGTIVLMVVTFGGIYLVLLVAFGFRQIRTTTTFVDEKKQEVVIRKQDQVFIHWYPGCITSFTPEAPQYQTISLSTYTEEIK